MPNWEQTPEAIAKAMKDAIANASAALDQIGKQDPAKVNFKNTVSALENARAEVAGVANRAGLISQTNPNEALRNAAEEAIQTHQQWNLAIDYREDVHKAIKAFAGEKPKLKGEDEKLLVETLRDYRRAGMDLPEDKRQEIQQWRSELTKLATEFDSNLFAAKAPVTFTKAELEGLPEDFLKSAKTGNDSYQVMADTMWQYNAVQDNARSEATRRKLYLAHDSLAKETNTPVINRMLSLRNRIALGLGYKSWGDYQADVRMAKTAANAQKYIEDLAAGIQPKFEAELRDIQKMKAADTNDPNAKIYAWDWRYYTNRLTKQKFDVDKEALRAFFAYQQTLDGMFAVFGRVFEIRFDEIKPPFKWTDDLRLLVVSDESTAAPLGLLYLDLFPRDGKTGGGGAFEIVSGRRQSNGNYQAPVSAVILNFPPAAGDKPSLISHAEAEILFHELGHALHGIVTRATYTRFAGTNVPVDFVEAPSQMLQNWIWDKKVLDTFASDYRDASKKIPTEIIQKMNAAKMATAGLFYRRQFAFALMDLALHGPHPVAQPYDCLAIANAVLERVFLPIDPSTGFIASFRGFNGYDAGYYGYAWSDAIAADMATVFEKEGYFNRDAGLKLRREVYEPGGSRDVSESVEKFLGRKPSTEPFLKKLGVKRR